MSERRERAERIEFLRTKYGAEMLIDVAWVRDMPTFLRQGPHSLGFHDILLVTQGEGSYALDGHVHEVKPRSVFFMAPNQVRRWNVRDLDGLCLFFLHSFVDEFLSDGAFLDALPYFNCAAEAAALHLNAREATHLRRRLSEMQGEFAEPRRDSQLVLRAGLHATLIELARAHAARHPGIKPRAANATTAAFKALVRDLVRREHRVAPFARRLKVSANHLNVLCRQHLGTSAKAVIAEALTLEARRALVNSGRSAETIAVELGFRDPSYFARFFKRMTGQTPSAFRKRQLDAPPGASRETRQERAGKASASTVGRAESIR